MSNRRLVYEGPFTTDQLQEFLDKDYIKRLTTLHVDSQSITQLSDQQIKKANKALANPANVQKFNKAMQSILSSEIEAIEPYLREVDDETMLVYSTANHHHLCFRREFDDEDKHPFEPPMGVKVPPEADYTDIDAETVRKIQQWYLGLTDEQREQLARSVFTKSRDEPINE
jgi:hypothetical protein